MFPIFRDVLPIEGRSVDDSDRNLPDKRHSDEGTKCPEFISIFKFHYNKMMDVFYQNDRNCQKISDGTEYYNSIDNICSPCEEPSTDPTQYQLCLNFLLKRELKTIIKENNCLMRDDIPIYYDDETKTCRSCKKCKHGDCKIICTSRQEKEYVKLKEDESKGIAEVLPMINFISILISSLLLIMKCIYSYPMKKNLPENATPRKQRTGPSWTKKMNVYNLLFVIFCVLLPIEGRSVGDSDRNLPDKRNAEMRAQTAELKPRISFHHNELMDVFYQNHWNCQKISDGSEYYNSIDETCSTCEEPSIDPRQYQLCSNYFLKQELTSKLETIIRETINCLMRDDIPRYYDGETKTCRSCEKCEHGNCKIICTSRQEKEYLQLTEDESKGVTEVLPMINLILILIISVLLLIKCIYSCVMKQKIDQPNTDTEGEKESFRSNEASTPAAC